MPVTLDLASLQDIDDELTRLRKELAEVEAKLGPDEAVEEARRRLSELDEELANLSRDEKLLGLEADTIGAKVATEEGRLYEGTIKMPKELSSLEHEIATLRARKSEIEDRELGLLDRASELEREREEVAALEASLASAWQAGQATHEARAAALRAQEDTVLEKRHSHVEGIGSGTLELYEDLRRRKGGIAVCPANGAVCGGCRITMPDALRRRVFSGSELPQCPNCERVLVVR